MKYYTPAQAAKKLGVCRPTVCAMFDRGELSGMTLNGPQRKRRRISVASVDRYLKAAQ